MDGKIVHKEESGGEVHLNSGSLASLDSIISNW